jgi:hypothetical protein
VEAVVFRSVGRLARVEVGVPDEQGKRQAERTEEAARELEALLGEGGG